jgi:hypothetical protein
VSIFFLKGLADTRINSSLFLYVALKRISGISLKLTLPVFFVFSALIIGTTLTAGCWTESPGFHPTHTLVLTKFFQNGSMSWSKHYDSLGDVSGSRIIQTPRGDYLIAASVPIPEHFCNYQGQLIRISEKGDVLLRKISAPVRCSYGLQVTPTGDIISIAGMEVCRFSPDGYVISNFSIPAPGGVGVQTRDGGYLTVGSIEKRPMKTKEEFTKVIGGASYSEHAWNLMCINQSPPDSACYKLDYKITLVKSDSDGIETWRYVFNNGGFVDQLGPVFESADGNTYSVYSAYNNDYDSVYRHQLFIQLTKDGKLKNVVNISDVAERENMSPLQFSGNLKSLVITKDPPVIVFFKPDGNPVEKLILSNEYSGLTQISDTEVMAVQNRNPVKFNTSGKPTWEAILPYSTKIGKVSEVIPTSDGGGIILSNIQNSSTTWP